MIQNIRAKLTEKVNLANEAWCFRFKLVEPGSLDFTAGQYLITKIPPDSIQKSLPPGVNFFRRHFSIASPSYQKDDFEVVIQMINGGIASTYYKNLNVGAEVLYDGPAGVFTLQSHDRNKIFLATGTGIAPIRSILLSNLTTDNLQLTTNIYLFWGLRNFQETYFFNELKSLAEKNTNFTFKICLSRQEDFSSLDRDYFAKGRVNIQLAEFLTHSFEDSESTPTQSGQVKEYINKFEYYLCGGRVIIESLRQFILGMGINGANIFFEKF